MDFKFRDFFSIEPSSNTATGQSSDPEIRNKASSCKGLKVTMSASHAAKLTKNFTLYPPATFQRCSHTFVAPYQKPVQTHHDDRSDPIGRVIGARFVPYVVSDFADEYRDVFVRFLDKASKSSVLDSVQFLEETGVIYDKDWKGLGELELETLITDRLAIEKILDGRYSTVSVGMEPCQVYCSICKKDWLKDREPCEHPKGEKDEESGSIAYLISGDIVGMEVSYINHPADDLAFNKESSVVEVESQGQGPEIINIPYGQIQNAAKRTVAYELLDSFDYEKFEEANNVQEEKEEGEVLADSKANEEGDLVTVEDAVRIAIEDPESMLDAHSLLINLTIEDKALTAKERNRLPNSSFCGPDRSYPADTKARAVSALSRVKQFGSASLQKRVRACVCKKFPGLPTCKRSQDAAPSWSQEILEELDKTIDHPITGAKTTLGQYVFSIEDALTEQDLSRLDDGVFCGPNRSFQVLSLYHYEAAMELLDSYQGEGNMENLKEKLEDSKETIEDSALEEVEPQEKIQDEVQAEPENEEVLEESCLLDGLDDDALSSLYLDMEKEMVSRKIRAPRQCFECDSRDEEKKGLEDKIADLENTVSVLRKEMATVINDCTAADDKIVELTESLTALYRDGVVTYKTLIDKEAQQEEVENSVKELELDSLKESFAKLSDEMITVVEFVRSGLTQEPAEEEKVTINDAADQEEEVAEALPEWSQEEVTLFRRLKKFNDGNKLFAEKHLQELKAANKIRKDLTLEQICDAVKVD